MAYINNSFLGKPDGPVGTTSTSPVENVRMEAGCLWGSSMMRDVVNEETSIVVRIEEMGRAVSVCMLLVE